MAAAGAAKATKSAKGHLSTLVKYVAAAYLVREHIAEFTICVGPSMMPTFAPSGEVALVERMFMATTLRNKPIQKGDIVIAKSVQNPKQSVCKRVVGLEGDVVTYRDVTRVRYHVDGYGRYDPDGNSRNRSSSRNSRNRSSSSSSSSSENMRHVVVPKGHVFIQGDNESNSTDSRQYGPVPYATLQGRVVAKVWPTMGWVT